jgi:hypothetical protein
MLHDILFEMSGNERASRVIRELTVFRPDTGVIDKGDLRGKKEIA